MPRCKRKTRLHTRVDHLSAMLFSDFNDFVASEISSNRGVLASLANDVGFIGLCSSTTFLSVQQCLFATKGHTEKKEHRM